MKKINLTIGILILTFIIGLFLIYNFNSNKIADSYLQNKGFERRSFAYKGTLSRTYYFSKKDYTIFHIGKNGDVYAKVFEEKSYDIFPFRSEKLTVNLPDEIDNENIFNIAVFNDSLIDISCNNDRSVWSLNLATNKLNHQYVFPKYFSRSLRIDKESFVTLMEKDTNTGVYFSRMDFSQGGVPVVSYSNNFLTSAMVEDGYLLHEGRNLIYVHAYNNQIIYLSEKLDSIAYATTIDTITSLPTIQQIKKGPYTYTKFSSPPRLTNKSAVAYKGKLFINSLVRSSDQVSESGKSIIDVYSIKDKTYEGSLYFADDDGEKMVEFFIENSYLVILYPSNIMLYEFDF